MKKISMTEREMMEDGLNSQKLMTAQYNNYATECTNSQLRQAMLSILNQEQELGAEIYEEMSARGWYQVETASQSELDKVKQKFVN